MIFLLIQEHGRRAGFLPRHVTIIKQLFHRELEAQIIPSQTATVKTLARNHHDAKQLSPFTAKQICDKLRALQKKLNRP